MKKTIIEKFRDSDEVLTNAEYLKLYTNAEIICCLLSRLSPKYTMFRSGLISISNRCLDVLLARKIPFQDICFEKTHFSNECVIFIQKVEDATAQTGQFNDNDKILANNILLEFNTLQRLAIIFGDELSLLIDDIKRLSKQMTHIANN